MTDCPVNRTVYGNPCDGPGTYYCDSDLWHSQCRRYFEKRRSDATPTGPASNPRVLCDTAHALDGRP